MDCDFRGKFIVLDGPDGCGKSTQAKMLSDAIEAGGVEVMSFRDPGSTDIGEKIRDILLDCRHKAMSDNTEVLLYMAARAQLWKELIKPALERGCCVVMDRWLSSTCAYQGRAGGFGIANVIDLAQLSLERCWPDVTVVIDIAPDIAFARINERSLDRMELKGSDYHSLVRRGYLELFDMRTELGCRMEMVEGSGSPELVQEKIKGLLQSI